MAWYWQTLISIAAALLLIWPRLVIALLIRKPDTVRLKEALRLLPELIGLLRRLAADSALPRDVRVRHGPLLAYLAMPFDLVPDFIPVLGYAADAATRAPSTPTIPRRWQRRRVALAHAASQRPE